MTQQTSTEERRAYWNKTAALAVTNETAFVELYNEFFPVVYKFLLSKCRNGEMADEAVSRTFLNMYAHLAEYDEKRGAFSTWLFRIAVNCAKDAVRSAARRPATSLSFAGEEDEDGAAEWDIPVTSGDTVPEDAVERQELIQAVRRAVEALPDDQRQVVILRDLHGLPYQEISAMLGVELGTVKSRLNRGRANLKTILENGNFL